MKILKEMYGLIYGEMPSGAEQQELYREVERIKDPLRGRADFDEIEEAEALLNKAMETASIYTGKIAVIAGNSYSYGADDNEIIIRDAEVIAM